MSLSLPEAEHARELASSESHLAQKIYRSLEEIICDNIIFPEIEFHGFHIEVISNQQNKHLTLTNSEYLDNFRLPTVYTIVGVIISKFHQH